jgi:hypothetical protein
LNRIEPADGNITYLSFSAPFSALIQSKMDWQASSLQMKHKPCSLTTSSAASHGGLKSYHSFSPLPWRYLCIPLWIVEY